MAGTTRTSRPAAQRGRTALLIDLENLLWDESRPNGSTRPFTPATPERPLLDDLPYTWLDEVRADDMVARARLEAFRVLGADPDYTLAAAVGILMRRAAFLPSMRDVTRRLVPLGADQADLLLLDTAEHLAKIGYARFVIASGDHAFADFAARHEVTILARSRRSLSRELRDAAADLRILGPDPVAA